MSIVATPCAGRTMRFEDEPRPPAEGSFAAERGQLALRLEQLRSRIRDTDWSDPDLLARAGTICLELGQRDEAVTLFERVLFLDRNNAYARAMLLDNCSSEEIRRMQLPAASRSVRGRNEDRRQSVANMNASGQILRTSCVPSAPWRSSSAQTNGCRPRALLCPPWRLRGCGRGA